MGSARLTGGHDEHDGVFSGFDALVFGEEDIEAASRERKRRARNSNKDTLHFTVVIVLALCQE